MLPDGTPGKLVVRKTFLEMEGDTTEKDTLRRTQSDSDISSDSIPPSRDEIEEWLAEPINHDRSTPCAQGVGNHRISHDLFISSSSGSSPSNKASTVYDPPPAPQRLAPNASVPEQAAQDLYIMLLNGYESAKEEQALDEFNEIVTKLDKSKALRHHIPNDDEGRPASLGSIMHSKPPIGEYCSPCIFFVNKRCKRAELCLRCHFIHPELAPKKPRASPSTRKRRARNGTNSQKNVTDGYPGSSSQNYYTEDPTERTLEDYEAPRSSAKLLISL